MRLLPFVALLTVACAPPLTVGTPCDLTSECPEPLVCRNERCRSECVNERDCAPGLRCVVSQSSAVCTLPAEESCTPTSCPGELVCAASECRTECDATRRCTATGECVSGTCVERRSGQDGGMSMPDGGADAPVDAPVDAPRSDAAVNATSCLTCGNGVSEACSADLAEVAAVVGGGAMGELTMLPMNALPVRTWPTEFDQPLVPEVALGLSASGYGVVAMIAENTDREVVAHRFDLDDLSTARPAGIERPGFTPLTTPIGRARTIALREDGDDVLGFVLITEPGTPSSTSGHRLIFTAESAIEAPIGAGDPVAMTGGHMAILGGDRSIRTGGAPIVFVTREIAASGPVLGAIDLGLATYRATLTPGFTSRVADTAGSAGSIALIHDVGPTIGIWNTARAVEGTLTADLVVTDVGASGAPAIELVNAASFEYVIAVPVEVGGVGYTRFFRQVCPPAAPCGTPTMVSDLVSRAGRTPAAVRIAALPGGYVLAALEPQPSGGHAVYLRFLDSTFTATDTELDGPLIPAPLVPAREDILAIDLAAVSDGSLVTVVVAALVRNTETTQDHVVLAGLQACVTR